jgi:hypothetical protein
MDDNKFWLSIWTVVALCMTAVLICLIFGDQRADRLVADMVAKGIDPVAARCGISGFQNGPASAICRLKN